MKSFTLSFLLAISLLSCGGSGSSGQNQNSQPNPPSLGGLNMMLMGNSFFRPYAEKLGELAVDAGYTDHNANVVFRGGDNGRPLDLWNDVSASAEIKSVLDGGSIDMFGMVSTLNDDPNDPNTLLNGYEEWINYALTNNPNIIVFIAIPQIDFPETWPQRATENGYADINALFDWWVNDFSNDTLVDALRVRFPNTTFFSIPTGLASLKLTQMWQDNLLLDTIAFRGAKATSLYTDEKGHQGDIIINAGTLIWLNSIYKVNLTNNTYNTGFQTNLHTIAQDIMNAYDPAYKRP